MVWWNLIVHVREVLKKDCDWWSMTTFCATVIISDGDFYTGCQNFIYHHWQSFSPGSSHPDNQISLSSLNSCCQPWKTYHIWVIWKELSTLTPWLLHTKWNVQGGVAKIKMHDTVCNLKLPPQVQLQIFNSLHKREKFVMEEPRIVLLNSEIMKNGCQGISKNREWG